MIKRPQIIASKFPIWKKYGIIDISEKCLSVMQILNWEFTCNYLGPLNHIVELLLQNTLNPSVFGRFFSAI
jgi:hypothetical protein